MDSSPIDRVGLMLVRERRIALALAPASQWADLYGTHMLRLEFPHVACTPDASAHEQALALSMAFYGRSATLLPTAWTYGPSPRHAIDRQPATSPTVAPFLRSVRMAPPDDAPGAAPRSITTMVFRATPDGEMAPNPQVTAGALWLPLAALRLLIRGVAVVEALSLAGVEMRLAEGVTLPSDGVIFLPADVGERMLSRIGAKYGEGALFATPSARA